MAPAIRAGEIERMKFSRRRELGRRDAVRSFEDVLDRAKAGDDDAIADLYLSHVAMVYGYLMACRAPEPEDATSEVFTGMLRALDRFEGDRAAFRRWLMTITHRRLVDQRRRLHRNRIELIEPSALDSSSPRHLADPGVGEMNQDLVAAFAELTDAQREVLALRFVADVSLQDVCDITGRPMTAVKSLQNRGLAALRRRVPDPALSKEAAP
jgi:RNA polymerase sigma-70 factor (ECF subfamily)